MADVSGDGPVGGPAVVLHIPHSSMVVPDDVRHTFALTDEALGRELLRLTDRYTDELFALAPPEATSVVFGVSRLVVDPERFLDDAEEPMAARGMGAAYMRTTDGAHLRGSLTHSERASLLARFYEPHHAALDAATAAALRDHGRCLLIDCHSFPSEPLPCDLDQRRPRPDVCLGTDAYHTQPALVDAAISSFRLHGLRVAVDRPYSGALVPARWYHRDKRVIALMIEINRRLYMDEVTGARSAAFSRTADTVRTALSALIAEHADAAACM